MYANPSPPPRATRREWIGLLVIALPCLLYAMDLTVLTLAIPALSADLQPSSTELLWIVDIYGFLVAGFLITMGTLGDRIGRRRLLLIGAASFGAASVLAAFSSSPEMLIASRALLGIAGATLAPSTLSLIRSMFEDDRQRTVAIGIWITSFSTGAAIGPLVGGVLLESFHWSSVFLLAVPVMALLLAVGPRLLPEYKDPEPGRLDLSSAALSLVAVLAVIFGVKTIATDGIGVAGVAPLAAGLVVAAVFVDRQRRLADPMIDLGLFRRPAFSLALGANTLGFAVVFGLEVFVAQYFQLVLGYSPLEAGLWSVPGAAAFVVGSQLTPPLVARVRPPVAMLGGTIVALAGVVLLTQASATDGPALVVAGLVVVSLGLAPLFTLAVDLAVGSAPPERAGAASGLSETSSELGGALGLAILGTIGAAVYRHDAAGAMPHGVPHDAAATAGDTLGGAVEVADRLPQHLAAGVLESAREAFVQGLQAAASVSSVLLIFAAVMVGRLWWRDRDRRNSRARLASACALT
ncbi:MAG TPA: MFS transporter [Solirubrobacteraceae bacterium]|nr:MFS transporter [Solirubrobacteraceae bacterium]